MNLAPKRNLAAPAAPAVKLQDKKKKPASAPAVSPSLPRYDLAKTSLLFNPAAV